MGIDPVKVEDGEGMSMFHRRMMRAETISSDIALRIAETVFVRIYEKEHTEARSPLMVVDAGDRWEVRSHEGVPPGERLLMVIVKTNGRILELATF